MAARVTNWLENRSFEVGIRNYQFDPERILAPEIRVLARLAQGIHAVLLFPRCRSGETRQLENDP